MEILKVNSTSPGVRHLIKLKKNLLSKSNNIYKSNVAKKKKKRGKS